MTATTLQVYREPAPETPPVFCRDCRHRVGWAGEPHSLDQCSAEDRFETCPVTGDRRLTTLHFARGERPRCSDRNASLACPDHSPLPPVPAPPPRRSLWSRMGRLLMRRLVYLL